MSHRRWALFAVFAVLLVGAAGAGGYVLGHRSVPDKQDALAARQEAKRVAFKRTSVRSIGGGRRSGVELGRVAGRRAARRLGGTRGFRAGTLAAAKSSSHRTRIPPASGVLRPATSSPLLAGSGGALVVGDSLEVLTSPYLKQYLHGIPLTVNAVGGYNSFQIFDLFKQSYDPSQSVIVFDSGTNDDPAYPQILAGRLDAVARIIGNRCMVVPTIHGLNVNGITSAGKNRVVHQFAASRPGTQTPDWAGFVAAHPDLMQPDNLHPLPAGANDRARLIAQGIRDCLAAGGP
jgi:hypothetical protein